MVKWFILVFSVIFYGSLAISLHPNPLGLLQLKTTTPCPASGECEQSKSGIPRKCCVTTASPLPSKVKHRNKCVSDEIFLAAGCQAPVTQLSSAERTEQANRERAPCYYGNPTPVRREPTERAVMMLWFGDGPLNWIARTNILFWRAANYQVRVYAHKKEGSDAHTCSSLGLAEGDAEVIDLTRQLNTDEGVFSDCREFMRKVILSWLVVNRNAQWAGDRTYNIVDLTKSYLAATQVGIFADTKVGPSLHLGLYATAFLEYFLSYSREGVAEGVVENQLMGTLKADGTLQAQYGHAFGQRMITAVLGNSGNLLEQWTSMAGNNNLFNQLTGYHSTSFERTERHLDTAKQLPDGAEFTKGDVKVMEPGSQSMGPFCVYRHPNDQSNKATRVRTKDTDIVSLFMANLAGAENKGEVFSKDWLRKAEQALNSVPDCNHQVVSETCKCGTSVYFCVANDKEPERCVTNKCTKVATTPTTTTTTTPTTAAPTTTPTPTTATGGD